MLDKMKPDRFGDMSWGFQQRPCSRFNISACSPQLQRLSVHGVAEHSIYEMMRHSTWINDDPKPKVQLPTDVQNCVTLE